MNPTRIPQIMNKDAEGVSREPEYCKLVDEFYQQNKDTVSPEDYEKAKEDPVYFKALVTRLTDLYQGIGRELLLNDRNYYVWENQFTRQKQNRD